MNAAAANAPTPGAPYFNGQSNRFTLGGDWFVKRDPTNQGTRSRWERTTDFSTWERVNVPHAFNAGDYSEVSYTGGQAWYATEFTRPAARRGSSWILRFESVNYKAKVWLNGKLLGTHTGGYVPFELDARSVRPGVNRLVIRADSRLTENSVPSQEVRNDQLTGGWWNYGGILREVLLRRVDTVDIVGVATRSRQRCSRCAASVTVLARVRNMGKRRQRVAVRARFGSRPVRFRPVTLKPGRSAELSGTVVVRRPKTWAPLTPNLYTVSVAAATRGGRARFVQRAGIRRIVVNRSGTLSVNGRKARFRGVSYHEADDRAGAALLPAHRDQIHALVQQLGANMIRSHYPLHPATMEWADRNGVFVWSQAPVFRPRETQLKNRIFRRNAAAAVREMVLANREHPSVLVWSLVNEAVPAGITYINTTVTALKAAARRADPGGLVGVDYAAAPEDELQHPAYRKMDVIGINEYFGWYPGLLGSTLDMAALAPYLEYLHGAYPRQALFVTEFGAEANRSGSADEMGTYEFQTNFFISQLRILNAQPFLNGVFAWALKDYPVRPDWNGGNPDPTPPYSKKGLFELDGTPKPAAAEVERAFKATPPYR